MSKLKTESQMSKLPQKPGVYIFRDADAQPLYVGKAIDLKNRVKSYFQKGLELGPKTTLMVSKIKKIEHVVVESEIEALLLEADLIKRLKPRYNVQWKDDKYYKYISIAKVKSQKSKRSSKLKTTDPGRYPKVVTSRKTDNRAMYFGPFPEGQTVNQVLRSLRRIFPFRDCSQTKFRRYQRLERSCLYGDLKLCPSPCIGWISKLDYQKIMRQLQSFLSGKSKYVIRELKKEMEKYSKNKEYERAAAIRDRIRNYEYVRQSFRPSLAYLERPGLVDDVRQQELADLSKLVGADVSRIEAFDISNISGEHAVGSLVVFVGGEPEKRDYRRYRIKSVKGISDVAMIKEVLWRRFRRRANLPDLLLIDGGKPQVSAAKEVLAELDLKIPLLGLAKRSESIINSQLSTLNLPKDSPTLHLLQRIRDEAHRFALSYHKKLRSQGVLKS